MNDNIDDPDEGLPPPGTPDDIEGALKWLEGLTAREGKQSEQPSISEASLESPFHGLIDSAEGDMPDWLREVPSALSSTQGEMESRLDWLAKMAQRESIEELPTLEWRRLPEPIKNSILSARGEADPTVDSLPAEEDMAAQKQDADEEAALSPDIIPIDAPGLPEYEDPPVEDLDAAMAWIEELAASQDAPIEDIPSVADRALASKLMMEAGLTPDSSPMNEMISDSALLDSIVPTHPFLEEEDSADTIVLGETTGPDPADLIPPTVESATGEVVIAGESFDEQVSDEPPQFSDTSTDLAEDLEAGRIEDLPDGAAVDEAGEALSFEEAMAYLDEIATSSSAESPEIDLETSDRETEIETLPVDQATEDTGEIALVDSMADTIAVEETGEVDDLLAEEAPWLEHDASLEIEPAIDRDSIVATDELAIDEIPFETLGRDVDSEMANSTDEILETVGDEDLNAEEAPWYEESQLFPEIETEKNGDDLYAPVVDQQEFSPSADTAFVSKPLPESQPEELWEAIDFEVVSDEDDLSGDASEEPLPEAPLPDNDWSLEGAAGPGGAIDGTQLEEALLTLDSMALPSGKTLADIDAAWREVPVAPTRDIATALAWLESALAPAEPVQPSHAHVPELEEAELIDRMPDDPDAILAWLEQMSDEDIISPPPPVFSNEKPLTPDAISDTYEPLNDDFFEADLLAMPEDPDEAMIWLESLARGGEPPPMPSKVELIIPETQDLPEDKPFLETVAGQRGQESDQAEAEDQSEMPSTDNDSEPPDTIGDQPGDGWVDLLKPID